MGFKDLRFKSFLGKLVKFLPIILILLFALFLRSYGLERRTSFDADQEEIAGRARDLVSGHPVLLGPKTSLGGFSIGPGFTYLWGISSIFTKGNPIAGAYTSIALGIGFILFLYLFIRRVYSEKTALILSFLSAISLSLIVWDQNPWAPSLFYLSEIMMMYGGYISDKKDYGVFISSLGLSIGFQSHFAIFLLPPAILVYWLVFKPKLQRKWLLYSLLIIFAGFAPAVIFDLTHNFINLERLMSVFKIVVSGTAPPITKIILTLISNAVSFYFVFSSVSLRILIFVGIILICAIGAFKEKIYRKVIILSLLFLFIPFAFFLFYRSNFSEYYLMSAITPFIILSGYLFEKINRYYILSLFIVLYFTFINLRDWKTYNRSINLWAKEEAVKTIVAKGGKSGYGVSLSVEPGYGFGFDFLFNYYGASPEKAPFKNQNKIFTIIIPSGYKGIKSFETFDGVGLRWQGL